MSTLDKYKAVVRNIRPLFSHKTCKKCGKKIKHDIAWQVRYDLDKTFELCRECCLNEVEVRGFCSRIDLTISHFE